MVEKRNVADGQPQDLYLRQLLVRRESGQQLPQLPEGGVERLDANPLPGGVGRPVLFRRSSVLPSFLPRRRRRSSSGSRGYRAAVMGRSSGMIPDQSPGLGAMGDVVIRFPLGGGGGGGGRSGDWLEGSVVEEVRGKVKVEGGIERNFEADPVCLLLLRR